MDFILLWLGSLYAVCLAVAAVEAAKRKMPWREFAGGAVFVAAMLAIFGALLHLGVSWLSHNPWGWLLLLGFIVAVFCIWFVVGVTGLIVRLLYRD